MLTFCFRDDDTNYFTTPEQLESAYSPLWRNGPVSLSVVPFHKGCRSKGIPESHWKTGEVYPLENNQELVAYLRDKLHRGDVEVMLHGYHHEDFVNGPEFVAGSDLINKVFHGKEYLERLLDTKIRVFIPPHNQISRNGLKAVVAAGLHLGSMPGLRMAWPLTSWQSWGNWLRIKYWSTITGLSYPWVIDLGGHREVMAHAVTPYSDLQKLQQELAQASLRNGVFCLATHHWEFNAEHVQPGMLGVRQQVYDLINQACSQKSLRWSTLGNILTERRK